MILFSSQNLSLPNSQLVLTHFHFWLHLISLTLLIPSPGGPVHPCTLPPHALFKTHHHCSHPCLSSLSVLPTHGLHVIQSLAGPAASSLPQPRPESQQRDGLLALQDRPQEDNRLRPGGSCWLTRIMWFIFWTLIRVLLALVLFHLCLVDTAPD